ncbi:type I restriction endonuclease subunit R [Chloroflexia bacterium SDU3-3]|nr:type I restriction endonuclease subunit R [Chloroflexia bacterium SDU3-3]
MEPSSHFTESMVERAALAWLESVGYTVLSGPQIAPGEPQAERASYEQVVLPERLRSALQRLNPQLPAEALDEAYRRCAQPAAPALLQSNRAFHRMLIEGVPVEYRRPDGTIASDSARLLDFDSPLQNSWLAINQLSIHENRQTRRPDIILYVNGLPLIVIELKNAADAKATIWQAFGQLQTYKRELPSLFAYNAALVISDGTEARIGSLTADRERFLPWRTVDGEDLAPASMPQLQVLTKGILEPSRLLDLIRSFIVFEDHGGGNIEKKLAAYHQYHAVNKAVESTIAATSVEGSRRAGVVWHTQGSGKSLTMVFYAGRLVIHPAMQNPTIIVLTDRIDLDDQLFGVFARCHDLLRQTPTQAADRAHLRQLLGVAAGGVVFTTIQKFLPPEGAADAALSQRRNIVVIADEAHRSQYGFEGKLNPETGEITYGFAQRVRDALPNASFLGFTGTPIELTDRNTRSVFGDYIDIYDIQRAVADGATVPIYYENRVARLELPEPEKPKVDTAFDELTEGEEIERKEALKSKWSALEAIVGTEKRLALIAADLVEHFEQRQQVMQGKAMIVCMSRRICVDLYQQLIALRPDWHSDDDDQGALKIIMTGSAADPADWQTHIRTKARRESLAQRFRDPADRFQLVIVRDMWLTGFDAPSLHTMYVDKPMHGHSLMQAIARVNRVFRDKPGGLVVDYLGLADQLKLALADYTLSGGQGQTTHLQEEAVAAMREKYEICCDLFHGFDWSAWSSGTPSERLSLLPAAQEHIFEREDGPARLSQAVAALSKAFALATPHEQALRIREDVAFFQTIRAAVTKTTASGRAIRDDQLDHAVRQIVAQAIAPGEVINIFQAAGLPNPDISILSEDFLAEVRGLPHKNLAVELLRKLLDDEIKTRQRTSLVQSRAFSEKLEASVRAYQNRAIETAQVIEQLIELARHIKDAERRGEQSGLTPEELAFYEALGVSDSAVQVLGDDILKSIARDLVEAIRRNITIDWTVRESVQARMRVLVKRILRKHGYPPDQQEVATQTVLQQAELLSDVLSAP